MIEEQNALYREDIFTLTQEFTGEGYDFIGAIHPKFDLVKYVEEKKPVEVKKLHFKGRYFLFERKV